MIDLRTATLRASPDYEVIPVGRLSEQERLYVHATAGASSDHVVLQPARDDGRPLKTACRRTADLIDALHNPGLVPEPVQAALGDELQQTVGALVLDGVLEVEYEGGFVSGPRAQRLVQDGELPEAAGLLAQLSLAAIDYAAALRIANPGELAGRLYSYGSLPLSARWRRRLGDPAALAARLERAAPRGRWTLAKRADERDPWIAWHVRGERRPSDTGLTYKLYLSPRPEAVVEVLALLGEAGEQLRAFHVKVGGTHASVLRPDKLVVYFTSQADLLAAAHTLARTLNGCPAQGVPFTAELTPQGLLSWAIDPSAPDPHAPREASESWRMWVSSRLAVAIIAANARGAPAREFALGRIAVEGVDVSSWTPVGRAWQAAE